MGRAATGTGGQAPLGGLGAGSASGRLSAVSLLLGAAVLLFRRRASVATPPGCHWVTAQTRSSCRARGGRTAPRRASASWPWRQSRGRGPGRHGERRRSCGQPRRWGPGSGWPPLSCSVVGRHLHVHWDPWALRFLARSSLSGFQFPRLWDGTGVWAGPKEPRMGRAHCRGLSPSLETLKPAPQSSEPSAVASEPRLPARSPS